MHELAGVWLDHYSDTHGDTVQARFNSYCDNGREVLEGSRGGIFSRPERNDLPSVAEIVDLSTKRREHYIRKPCLVGMELRWRAGESLVECLSEEQLRRMLAFRLTYGAEKEPAWFSHLVQIRPALVAEVLIAYASATLKAKQEFVYGLYALAHDDAYRAEPNWHAIPLLTSFPGRIKAPLLSSARTFAESSPALRSSAVESAAGTKPGALMNVPQRVYWLTAGMLVAPPQYESQLWRIHPARPGVVPITCVLSWSDRLQWLEQRLRAVRRYAEQVD